MILNKKYHLIVLIMLFFLLLMTSCGPSPEELAATSAAETAAGATSTPLPTSTPSPTIPPPPTDTPTPLPLTSTPFPPFRDDFDQLLEDGWEWLHEIRFGWNHHENPGFLRIEVREDNSKQVLVREVPEGNFEISTRVLFQPYQNFQSAGLIIMMDEDHWLQLHRGMAYIPDATFCCIGNAIYYNNIDQVLGVPGEGYSVGPQFPTKVDLLDEAYLRLTRVGKTYTAYYSDNGENWIIIGKHDLDLIPKYVGIQTFGAQKYPADADFDYFTLELLP